MIKKTVTASSFILRHFIASLVSVLVPMIMLAILYLVLLILAIFTNAGLGSPVALPLWEIFILVVSTLYTALLLFPSVWIAEVISHRLPKWQHIAQIPVSTLVLVVLTYTACLIARSSPHYADEVILQWAERPLLVFLILAIPLGIYWWTMKIIQTGFSTPISLVGRLITADKSKRISDL